MPKKPIYPDPANKPRGYSPAVHIGNFVYVSGQLALGPKDEIIGGTDCRAQTKQCFKNMEAALTAAGASMSQVVKITAFLTTREHFLAYAEVRGQVFAQDAPASSTVVVSGLAVQGCLVEVEAIAVIE